jgi:hypothetical protein
MSAYNGMHRCSGGQKAPARVRGWLGECARCGRWLKRYPNGMVVMHKRKVSS